MCGIAGYVGAREIAPEVIHGCLGLMHRRGSDQEDFDVTGQSMNHEV